MSNINRPQIKLELGIFDKVMEVLGFVSAILLIGIPVYFYSALPETIPTHFGLDGTADKFDSKSSVWILPVVGILTYIGLFFINKYPHTFNYIGKVTAENAERQYTIATKMIRVLNTLITCFFAYLVYGTIQIALDNQDKVGTSVTILFLVLIFGVIGYYGWLSIRKNKL